MRLPARRLERLSLAVSAIAASLLSIGSPAEASCSGMANLDRRPNIVPAAYRIAEIPSGNLRIAFVGHASFEIETPGGARILTDYNGYNRAGRLPHIVTMNRAHGSHYTDIVDPGIIHVLRGWDPAGGIARHNVAHLDARVRNIPTNLNNFGGKWSNDNSMFVIEAAGLCVVHISHLHHVLGPDQVTELGRVDIALAPIDGMWTMSHIELFEVLAKMEPRLIIPMHYGSPGGIQAFIAQAKTKYEVREHPDSSILVSFRTLPKSPEVLFLQGY